MARTVHYRQGYKIIINNKFYELIDGKTVLYFGELKHRPIVQEVWNKTIGLNQQEVVNENRRRIRANN